MVETIGRSSHLFPQCEYSPLSEGSVYKYLSVLDSNVFDTTQMKSLVRQKFLKRSKTVLQAQLNSGNMVKGINMFAIPVIRHIVLLY